METKEEILSKLNDVSISKLEWIAYIPTKITLKAMQEYAEEYHQSELLKLNKSDVISSVCDRKNQFIIDSHDVYKSMKYKTPNNSQNDL